VHMSGTKVSESSWKALSVKRGVKNASKSYTHGDETTSAYFLRFIQFALCIQE